MATVTVTLVGGPHDGHEVTVHDGVRFVEVPVQETVDGPPYWVIRRGRYEHAMDGRYYWRGIAKPPQLEAL